MLHAAWTGVPFERIEEISPVPTTSVTVVDYENGYFHIVQRGYCGHLTDKTAEERGNRIPSSSISPPKSMTVQYKNTPAKAKIAPKKAYTSKRTAAEELKIPQRQRFPMQISSGEFYRPTPRTDYFADFFSNRLSKVCAAIRSVLSSA